MEGDSHMPGRSTLGWRCSACGQLITSIEDGWVEWLAAENRRGVTRLKGLRLVHRFHTSLAPSEHGCRYDQRAVFRKDRSVVEGLPLERFIGPDGLMMLLSLIREGELPMADLLELAKRVQIPGYELVRELFKEASAEGVIEPVIGEGYYLQSDIQAVLRWAGQEFRSSEKPAL